MSVNQYTFNSLTVGAGTAYGLVSVTGLDTPDLRADDMARSDGHGVVAGTPYADARTITLTLNVTAASAAALGTLVDALRNALVPSTSPAALVFETTMFGASARRVFADRWRTAFDWTVQTEVGWLERVRVQFVCGDPRVYDDAATTTALSGTTAVTNSGNTAAGWPANSTAGPILTMTGGQTVTNNTDGGKAIVTTGSGTLVVNLGTKSVTKLGVNAYDQIDPTTEWFSLLPGANSLVMSSGSASIDHSHAWL